MSEDDELLVKQNTLTDEELESWLINKYSKHKQEIERLNKEKENLTNIVANKIIKDYDIETPLKDELNKSRLKNLGLESKVNRLNNIINGLEKILNYDIDKSEEYMNKIRRSSLQQGDYPVHYYRAEWQKEKAIGYLDKLQELKGDGSNE